MKYTIFLTDDDRFLLDMYALKFKNAGHDVTIFSDGEELLALLRKGSATPNAVLLDVVMPGLDGFMTLETIRKENLVPTAKVIMLSNQGQESDIEKAEKLGADGYIIKASAIPSEVFTETIRIIETPRSSKGTEPAQP